MNIIAPISLQGDALIQLYERYCSDHTDNAERVNEIRSTPAVMAVFGVCFIVGRDAQLIY